MLLYRPKYRHPERTVKPANLAEAEALGSGLNPLYADFSDLIVDVETPAGERLAIDDPRLLSMLSGGVRANHELTLLRSARSMTDCRPISIISNQTVHRLSKEMGSNLDKRRFRANLYVELKSGDGFGEDEFVGRTLKIGAKAAIAVLQRDSRCKMITLDPDTAQPSPDVMTRLARDHAGKAGIYGAVIVEGTIRPGDEIALD